jgi:LmeA-like phospholipid-binding
MLKLLLAIAVAGAAVYLLGATPQRAVVPEQAIADDVATKPGDVRVELTEAALTERLNQRLAGQSLGNTPLGTARLDALKARLRAGQVQVDGNAQVAGNAVPVTLTGNVEIESGRPNVNVVDARAAGMPLPDPARKSIEDALQQQVDQEVRQLGLRVNSISIADGKLVLTGVRTP